MTAQLPSKERLETLIRAIECESYDEEEIVSWVNSDEILSMARFALEAHEQEPTLHRYRRVSVEPFGPYPWHYGDFVGFSEPLDGIEDEYFYSHPAPIPNSESIRIADALESLLWPNMAVGNKAVIQAAIDALRTHPAPVPAVPDEVMPGGLVYSSALPKFESNDSDKVVGYCCFISGDTRIVESQEQAYADAKAVVSACRAAMLNGGKS
ncbi:hypothetical protein DFO55_101722 [Grimontella sp. AG753]|nr:hypothetical protein DFO55_101722 [Grimontella sp. AG753]